MVSLPSNVAAAREPSLAKALSHLPDEILSALAFGLERHAGRLEVGRLYADHDGGGCAVGVMLRELAPEAYRQTRLQFWVRRHRHRSVLSEPVAFERSLITRLSHVEMCFDQTAAAVRVHSPEADLAAAANATGRWMAECCRAELRARSRARHTGFFVPEEWQTATPERRRPATESRDADGAPMPTMSTSVRQLTACDGTVTLVAVPSARSPAAPASPAKIERLELLTAA